MFVRPLLCFKYIHINNHRWTSKDLLLWIFTWPMATGRCREVRWLAQDYISNCENSYLRRWSQAMWPGPLSVIPGGRSSHKEEEELAQMIPFHLRPVRAHERLWSCPFSRWGAGAHRRCSHQVNLVVESSAITPGQQGRGGGQVGGSRMQQGKCPHFTLRT